MNITKIAVHHTAVSREKNAHQLQAVDRYHRDKNWGTSTCPAKAMPSSIKNPETGKGYYVQYHWFIEPDGSTIQTASETDIRWHVGNYNNIALGICMTLNGDIELPTKEQEKALKVLLKYIRGRHPAAEVQGHRDFPGVTKSCPGKLIEDSWLKNLSKSDDMKKLIGNSNDGRQYVQGDDEICHWISPGILESFHSAGFVDKTQVEWRPHMDGLTIGESYGVVS
jgi:N-acetylmuramoyl-L-alanine amidase